MYSKLYARITESSLMEESIPVRYTFVLMLAISDPEGYVIGTDVAIARRLNMPLEEFRACLAVLMAPDPNSNSTAQEGRRIIVSDGERGYHLVNFAIYRDLKDPKERRDYMREYMREYRSKHAQAASHTPVTATVNKSKPQLAAVRHEPEPEYGDGEENVDLPVPTGEERVGATVVSHSEDTWPKVIELASQIARRLRVDPAHDPSGNTSGDMRGLMQLAWLLHAGAPLNAAANSALESTLEKSRTNPIGFFLSLTAKNAGTTWQELVKQCPDRRNCPNLDGTLNDK